MMPTRKRTRAAERAARIQTEREHNKLERERRDAEREKYEEERQRRKAERERQAGSLDGVAPPQILDPPGDSDPPPF
jgi:hypothetical protein